MQPGDGMTGAQAGTPQLVVAGLARSWAPRLLWKPRGQSGAARLVGGMATFGNGD